MSNSLITSILGIIRSPSFLYSVLRLTTPILLATMAALVSDRAGVTNISIEGTMLFSALMGVVGFISLANTGSQQMALNFGSIGIMFTAFLPMFIGGYIGRFSNDKLGYLMAALCMSMLNSTFAAFSNEISASAQSIINAVLLVVFLIYLNNEGLLKKILSPKKA